jgi:hypothetical protein
LERATECFNQSRVDGHDWMLVLPCHVLGNFDGGFHVHEQHAVPVLFEGSVRPFDGVVFAMVRGMVSKPEAYSALVCEVDGSFDEPGVPAAVFGTIVKVVDQARIGKAKALQAVC